MTCKKSAEFGALKDDPVSISQKTAKQNFLVAKGFPYNIIDENPTIETMSSAQYACRSVGSFTINCDRLKISIQPDYIHDDTGYIYPELIARSLGLLSVPMKTK